MIGMEGIKINVPREIFDEIKVRLVREQEVKVEFCDGNNDILIGKWKLCDSNGDKELENNELSNEVTQTSYSVDEINDENDNRSEEENNGSIVENPIGSKRKRRMNETGSRKKARNVEEIIIEEEEKKREEKLKMLIEELNDPENGRIELTENREEINKEFNDNIGKLVRQFVRIEVEKAERINEWFEYGQNFIRESENITVREKCKEQTAKRNLRKKMVEKANDIIQRGHKVVTMDAVIDSTKRAIRVWKLFVEIGDERRWRIRKTSPRFITELKMKEREQVIKYFKKS